MWTCPKCNEQIDDRFDSCWKCTKAPPAEEHRAQPGPRPQPPGGGFWRAWLRGWWVLLMLLINSFLVGLMTVPLHYTAGILPLGLAGLAAGLLLIPASSYWLFVVFFGKEAWPVSGPRSEMPREEKAFALLEEATKLESRGRVEEALAKYHEVVEQFGGTAASGDAQKSIESLKTRLG